MSDMYLSYARSVMTRARTQAERTRATTDQLVAAARELFATTGYDATFLDAVVERAGVTKGALYHHFDGKRALFAAVYEAPDSVEAARRLAVWEHNLPAAGVRELSAVWRTLQWWREPILAHFEDRHLMALIKHGIGQAMKDRHIQHRRIDPLAHQLHGAMCEAAMVIARAPDPAQEARDAHCALTDLLNGLTLTHNPIGHACGISLSGDGMGSGEADAAL